MPDEHDDGQPRPTPDRDALARAVERLSERVERLERELRITPASPGASAPGSGTRPREPVATPESATAPEPATPARATPPPTAKSTREGAARSFDPPASPAPTRTGPFARLREESGPVIWLGLTGGAALLMGLLYFAWYSIQQGWIPVEVRLVLTGVVGATALGLAWRVAARGHTALAEGLGGAGLGAWFGAALVARHGHQLIGPTATFALLVAGALAGLGVAADRNLRKLALFATLGALLTPLTVGEHGLGLSEWLGYQLVVVAFLYALEDRRPWPELGHLALVTSWMLLVYGSQELPSATRGEELSWLFALFLLGHLQLASLLWRRHIGLAQAVPRLWLHVFGAWAVAGVLSRTSETFGVVSLVMAAVNTGVCVLLPRALDRDVSRTSRAALAGACATVAWLQVFSFGPAYFERLGSIYWWTAMASVTTAAHLRAPSAALGAALTLPLYAALATHLAPLSPAPPWVGFYLAALPIGIGLAPRAGTLAVSIATDSSRAVSLLLGCIAWAAASWQGLRHLDPHEGWFVASCWVAAAVVTARSVRAPSPARVGVALLVQAALLCFCISLSAGLGFFRPHLPFAAGKAWQLGVLVGLAALTTGTGLGLRTAARENAWASRVFDWAALLRAAAVVAVAMLGVTAAVAHTMDSYAGARSLNQAGWSVCWAVAGLSLLLRGLYARRGLWRKAGLALLFTTAGKLLVVDLVSVSMIWRVLSFVGLGVCMLAGAYFYRRLADSLKAEPLSPGGPLQSPADP